MGVDLQNASENMDVTTTRFGTISVQKIDLLHFERGLIGLEQCRSWILLADGQNGSLGWLQNVDHTEVAVAIVSPRVFVSDYQLRVASHELPGLLPAIYPMDGPCPDSSSECPSPEIHSSGSTQDVQVVVIVSRQPEGLSLNLKAPLIINVQTRQGCQVVSRDDYPVRHPLMVPRTRSVTQEFKKIA